MIANMNMNKNRGVKILASVAIFAMVVCAFAAIVPADHVDATATIGNTPYNSFADAVDAIPEDGSNTTIVLTNNETITGTVDLKGATVLTNGYTLTIDANNTSISNGKITGDNDYVDLIIKGSNLTGILVDHIVFSTPGYFSIDIRSATVTISNCTFEGSASAAIYLEPDASDVTVTDCDFNGTYSEGSIDFDMGANGDIANKVTINSTDPTSVSIGSARGNMTIGGESANVVLGTNVSVSDVYLDINGQYTGAAAGKLTIATGNVSVNNVIGNGSVDVLKGATFSAVQSSVSVTGEGTKNVETSTVSTITPDNIAKAFESSSEVTIEVDDPVTFTGTIVVPANKTLNIINTTITGGTFEVNGTLSLDNSYVYAGADVNEITGEIIAINTHNPITTQSLTQNTSVGIGDSLTLTGAVPSGVTLSVYGTLITNDLTVDGAVEAYVGSTVTINGTVTVANKFTLKSGAELELNGTVTIRNDRNGGASLVIENGATMTVSSEGTVNVNKPTANGVDANVLDIKGSFVLEGTMTVTGKLLGKVDNKGEITFNGTAGDSASQTTIVMYDGVSMTVTSVTGYMDITDGTGNEIILDYLGKNALIDETTDKEVFSNGNTVTLYNVRGVTVSESITSGTDKVSNITYRSYMSNMTVSGTITIVNGQTTGSVTVNGACSDVLSGTGADVVRVGTMTVGDVTIGAGITFTFEGVSTVSSSFTAIAQATSGNNALAAAAIQNNGEVTVTGTMTLTTSNASNLEDGKINAVRYYVTDSTDGDITAYYTNFANSLSAVTGADNSEIVVLGNVTTEGVSELPAGSTLIVEGTLTIDSEAQITVAATASSINNGAIYVDGVLIIIDNNTGFSGRDPVYDVKKTVGYTDTYSSLTYALANANAGETIVLSKEVTLKADTVIPEGVTLETGRNKVILDKEITLTVNGTFAVQSGGSVDKTAEDTAIIVNGVMSVAGNTDVDSMANAYGVSGAYFVKKNVGYITNVAYASENVDDGTVTIMGQVVFGDVTFTERQGGNLNVIVKNLNATADGATVVSAGTITIDGARFQITTGTVSGTIAAAANGSTATIGLDKVKAESNLVLDIESSAETTVDGDVDMLYIARTINSGTVTIETGVVTIGTSSGTANLFTNSNDSSIKDGSLVVAEGATLEVPADASLTIRPDKNSEKTVFTVNGTISIENNVSITGDALVTGTANINDGGSLTVTGSLTITGTVAVTEVESETAEFVLDGSAVLTVGEKPTSLGAAGAITGEISIQDNSYIKVYAGADMSGAKINWQNDESTAVSTVFNINGTEYMAVYAVNKSAVTIQTILDAETFELPGYDVGLKGDSLPDTQQILYLDTNWYTADTMLANQKVAAESCVGTEVNASIYAHVDASYVNGVISAGTGLDLYIDNVKYDYYNFPNGLQVGTHTVSFEVTSGYDGSNAAITFNGETVQNGGTITITADMTTFTLVANGAVPSGQTVVIEGGSTGGSDSLGLTDYLLIILVILIVIMAIMVAFRLMRS